MGATADKAISMLQAAYDKSLTREARDVYRQALDHHPPDDLTRAVNHIIGTAKWFPKVSEINEAVALTSGLLPDVDEAWSEVAEAMRSIGRTGRPIWSHWMIDEAVKATGGYFRLCESQFGTADRARFIAAMNALHQTAVRNVARGEG